MSAITAFHLVMRCINSNTNASFGKRRAWLSYSPPRLTSQPRCCAACHCIGGDAGNAALIKAICWRAS
ncbi:Uncharacterised protein [Vibrio cholerae]|nr:Uncharacterised protein [Vibrio cholerae]